MSSPSKKGGAWTSEEKYLFLLKIIAQIGGGQDGTITGVHPKFADIDLNGRTPKALSEMWAKIKKEAVGLGTNAGGAAGGAASAPVTPQKRKANGTTKGTPASKKRTPASKGKKGKGKKMESDDSEEDDGPLDLGDTTDEEVVKTKSKAKAKAKSKVKVEVEDDGDEFDDDVEALAREQTEV